MASSVKKQSTGRRKIEIKKIENKSSLEVTFTKRRNGLFNKASELCILTGAEAAVIAFSPVMKAFAFGYPSVGTVIDHLLRGKATDQESMANTLVAHHKKRDEYVEAVAKLQEEKRRVQIMKQAGIFESGSDRFWWDQSIDGHMGLEELEHYVAAMEEMKKNVIGRGDELEKASNSPSRFLALDSAGFSAIDQLGF